MNDQSNVKKKQSPVPPVFLVNTVLRLRRFLMRLADSIVPAYLPALDRFMGAAHTSLIHSAARLRIPDLLKDGPLTSKEIAKLTESNEDVLDRMMKILVSINVFKRMSNGRYANNKISKGILTGTIGSIRGFAEFFGMEPVLRSWQELPNTLKDGKTAFDRIYGESVWDWMDKDQTALSNFVEGMSSMTEVVAPSIAANYPFKEVKKVCDVGGGSGIVLTAVLRKHPHLQGVLFDSQTMLNEATTHLNEWGVADRVELVAGSFFDKVPTGADAYIIKTVLHNWNDENAKKILINCREAMQPGNRLLVADFLHSADAISTLVPFMDYAGMMIYSGREREPQYLDRLFKETGFKRNRTFELPGRQAVFEAIAI
jgi:2-polyprenyl-3-methyl-5-hydroxy-6-metoxy-1,4-benzoquinol methylase